MRIDIDGLEVLWPYDYIYPEQLQYMSKLKSTLHGGHCLLEMPTGTGKTVSLLSLILSFQYADPTIGKLVYEMDKVVEELRRVQAYRTSIISAQIAEAVAAGNLAHGIRAPDILGVCLSSRRNLCIHPTVSKHDNRAKTDALCRNKTASFVREQKAAGADIEVCSFYEGYEKEGAEATLSGIFSIADLKSLGAQRGWCPYFTSRHLVSIANVVVYNYQYLLDPKIAGMVSRDIPKDSIVVFDEAHNIDNICIEALSCEVDKRMVQAASANVNKLQHAVLKMEKTDSKRLQDEYTRLVEGLSSSFGGLGDRDEDAGGGAAAAVAAPGTGANRAARHAEETDSLLGSPVLPSELLRESVPGNIRRAHHFLMFLRSWVEFLRHQLRQQEVRQKSTEAFLEELRVETKLSDLKALKFAYDRLQSLYRTLQITDMDDFNPLTAVVNLATMSAMYREGFTVLFEPYDERTPSIPDPKLQLCCLEASYAIKPVFERFRSVVITSGTLSPLDVYPRMLNFRPSVSESFSMSLSRNPICPMIVSKGSDQVPITSSYDLRSDVGVLQNYGRLLIELCAHVPDGIVAFFTSYKYMEDLVSAWKDQGILDEILRYKLIFIETKDIVETTLALDAYKRACNRGRGAVFLSVARGKVAEGIDFDRHYGRAVIMFGIPFQYTLSRVLRARLTYLREKHQMHEQDFLSFDALRQTAQCLVFGSQVLLFDGSVKRVEDLLLSDVLVAPDGTPLRIEQPAPDAAAAAGSSQQPATPPRTGDLRPSWAPPECMFVVAGSEQPFRPFVCTADHVLPLMEVRTVTRDGRTQRTEPAPVTLLARDMEAQFSTSAYKHGNHGLFLWKPTQPLDLQSADSAWWRDTVQAAVPDGLSALLERLIDGVLAALSAGAGAALPGWATASAWKDPSPMGDSVSRERDVFPAALVDAAREQLASSGDVSASLRAELLASLEQFVLCQLAWLLGIWSADGDAACTSVTQALDSHYCLGVEPDSPYQRVAGGYMPALSAEDADPGFTGVPDHVIPPPSGCFPPMRRSHWGVFARIERLMALLQEQFDCSLTDRASAAGSARYRLQCGTINGTFGRMLTALRLIGDKEHLYSADVMGRFLRAPLPFRRALLCGLLDGDGAWAVADRHFALRFSCADADGSARLVRFIRLLGLQCSEPAGGSSKGADQLLTGVVHSAQAPLLEAVQFMALWHKVRAVEPDWQPPARGNLSSVQVAAWPRKDELTGDGCAQLHNSGHFVVFNVVPQQQRPDSWQHHGEFLLADVTVTHNCLGRVIRSKQDYGLMILADQRFNRADKRSKLPGWIIQYLDKTHMNLSTDRALTVAKEFLKRMAQPRSHKEDLGTTMLDEPTVKRMMAAEKAQKEQMLLLDQEEKGQQGTGFVPHVADSGVPRAAPKPWTQADREAAIAADAAAGAAARANPAAPAQSPPGPAAMDID